MTPTKLLIGQILIVLAVVVLGVWAATQWAAAQLAYQPQLGPTWFVFWGLPVYRPWQLFIWWFHFEAYAPEVFHRAGVVAASSGLMGCGAAIAGSIWRARQAKFVTTYGSARWATRPEIERAGLFRDAGVFLGRFGADYLRHEGPEHVMAFAPTRSGKGVGLVVPTLLSWTNSVVVHDIKGENWELTAGWRSKFSHCLLFNPTDLRSARYNPLLEVRKGPQEVRDVQNIADILVDPEGSIEQRSHWEKTSHSLLVGAILHILYAEEHKTLERVATFLSDPQRTFVYTLHRMMTTNHLGDKDAPQVHPVVASAARELLNKSENERSGVLSTAMSFLGLYRDPVVAATTSRCDWRISDLMDAERPVSLFLVIPPSDISRTKPLVRLILNQIGRRLTERLEGDPDKRRKHQLLMMLDEFPALGRLDFFETALAFMAGYGIRTYLIAQSLNQISKAYGENNSILDNCHVRIAFSSNDERTARRISDALGTATELRAQKNYAGHRLSPWLAHVMVSRQETARQLLTPGEVMQLPPQDELVLVSGIAPIRAKKLRYFEDANFTTRRLPPPVLSETAFVDRPAGRPDDWQGRVRATSRQLAAALDGEATAEDEGGVQQQRHPGLGEGDAPATTEAPETTERVADDDSDLAADKRALDRVRTLTPVQRAHALHESQSKAAKSRHLDLFSDF
ncbi:conjugal transfer protein TraG [Asticcacaulis sp. BYS171W]|uniref:Conjugal transfer protein TraG n=1 Tax=Asticcacaulis aquaticus TaxID=2984212 RepID=A0ABT5HPZ4_9CAUL|nr:conjugal transfer protein TraG [Asticcacaulis aquaticus]MDC7682142.1 conjugal transfer protein TraG [Asticcacaulis aquaticus]